ncbi:MAG: helix-turn-helix domain-containing protein [Roseivirga sp.]|nr:helix-turn-helix domain-containing protein [Roseivirga sp.]
MAGSNIIVLEERAFEEMMEARLRAVLESIQPRFFVEDEILTTEEAAKFMKYSKSTVEKMVKRGELTPHRPGHDPRYLKSELFEFVRNS